MSSNFPQTFVCTRSRPTQTQLDTIPDSTTLNIEPALFSAIDPSGIAKLVETKDLRWLREQGGVEGLVSALQTHAENGIESNSADIDDRCRVFGSNFYGEDKPAKKFHHFGLEALKHPMIVILLVCAVLSVCFGIKENGRREGWCERVANFFAILIVVTISAVSNFLPQRLCQQLSEASSHILQVDVVRSSQGERIPITRIVVGDIVFLKPGGLVPADGLFLKGCSLQVKEEQTEGVVEVVSHDNPFLCSGSEVVVGHGQMLVTAVGKNRWTQKIHLQGEIINQSQQLISVIGKFGRAIAFVILLVKLAHLFSGKISNGQGKMIIIGGEEPIPIVDVLKALVAIVATPAMVAATSAPEGLLLAVKIALAYSMKRMLNEDNVVLRRPSICDAIGSVNTICTNMTGSLTIDNDEVDKLWLGFSYFEQPPANLIAPNVIELLHQGIGLNATHPPSGSFFQSPQNPTEKAIFDWANRRLGVDIDSLKRSYTIREIEPFSSENRQSRVLISKNDDNMIHEHWKGDPEKIIRLCSHYYEATGTVKVINQNERVLLNQILEDMSKNGLRCIAFAHREPSTRDCCPDQQLILLSLVGLKNSLRSGVEDVVKDCQRAGVNIRIITGNNIQTARAIATKCGIVGANEKPGEVVEGVEFQKYTQEERMKKVLNIYVMAGASPQDKLLMLQCLKQKGHVLTVIGCGIGDVQALRVADVGLCLGIQGADIAKACSDIIIQHENLASVISILKWGRGIFESVQIYTQLLLIASFVALVTDFVMAISTGEPSNIDAMALLSAGEVPYPALQVMWVKLIMDTLVALAVIIKQPAEELVNRPRRGRNEPLMTNSMLGNIMVQALYQIGILLTIHFKGKSIFNVNPNAKGTMILNTYVLCQIFTIFNVEKNVFQDIRKRKLFWGIIGIILILQVLMVEVLNRLADTARLDWGQWGTSIALAVVTWPISWIVECISELEKPFFSSSNWPKIEV